MDQKFLLNIYFIAMRKFIGQREHKMASMEIWSFKMFKIKTFWKKNQLFPICFFSSRWGVIFKGIIQTDFLSADERCPLFRGFL